MAAERLARGRKARESVLIVEDDAPARKLFSIHVALAGYRVLQAPTGEAALQLAGRHRPAVVLLDLLLPGMDGWEVLWHLKREPETCEIPVVIVSVLEHPGRAIQLGAADYLRKPVAGARLLQSLRRVELRRRSGER